MLEYALLASLIAVVAISSVSALGWTVNETLNDKAGFAIDNALASAGVN